MEVVTEETIDIQIRKTASRITLPAQIKQEEDMGQTSMVRRVAMRPTNIEPERAAREIRVVLLVFDQ